MFVHNLSQTGPHDCPKDQKQAYKSNYVKFDLDIMFAEAKPTMWKNSKNKTYLKVFFISWDELAWAEQK